MRGGGGVLLSPSTPFFVLPPVLLVHVHPSLPPRLFRSGPPQRQVLSRRGFVWPPALGLSNVMSRH